MVGAERLVPEQGKPEWGQEARPVSNVTSNPQVAMSIFRRNVSLVGLGLALVAGSAQAQLGVKAGSAPLSAGSTAAEVDLDGTFQASLLRFGEMNKAWKFAANIDVGRASVTVENPITGEDVTSSTTTFEISGSVGRREYKGGGSFRPFMGYGAGLGIGDLGNVSTFSVGPYVEIGGAYFVTPNFSVGAASTASLSFINTSPEGGDSSTDIGLRGRLVSMMATVYF